MQEKLTDLSAHLIFFTLELNKVDDKLIDSAFDGDPVFAAYDPGSSICARTSPISSKTGSSSFSTRSR